MRSGTRIIATVALAFLLVPILRADDTPAGEAKAKKDEAVNSPVTPGAVAKAEPVAATAAPLPATPVPQSRGTDSNTPKAELFLGYSFVRAMPRSVGNRIAWLHGGSASIAFNVNSYLGLVADIGGYRATELTLTGVGTPPTSVVDADGNVFTYLFGPRLSFRKHDRVTPFVQVLFGIAHASQVTLSGCTGASCSLLPSENALAMTAGGGFDLKVHRKVALRLVQAEYLMTRFMDPSSLTGQTATQHNLRLSTGIVFRFGGNPPPPPPNRPPVVSCSAEKSMVYAGSGDVVAVRAQASDPDNDPLTYSWMTGSGSVEGSGPEVRWNSSGTPPGTYTVKVRVDDGRGGTADCSVDIRVEPRPNRPPTMSCSADRSSVFVGEPVQITATASDPDNDPLTFSWSASGGRVIGSGSSVSFPTSGLAPGRYTVTGRVDDGRGGAADCAVNFDVQAPPPPAEVKQLEARLSLHSIYFQTARPTASNPSGGLVASQQTVLMSLAGDFKRYLTFRPEAHLILGGHADPRGSIAYNKTLTVRRVERTKRFLIEQGVPASSIETRTFGKQENLSSNQVRQLIEENPDLSAQDRRKILSNLQVIVLANNRRVDVSLSTTGQQSVRQYPFNAKDALTLISTKGEGTVPKKKTKKQ
jgi:outer membrane protein OmpA-like peptidoglycan-associated protein